MVRPLREADVSSDCLSSTKEVPMKRAFSTRDVVGLDRGVVVMLTLALVLLWRGIPTDAGGNHQLFPLGNFPLESGITLPDAKLSYVTHGTLNPEKTNAIVVPSFYSGDHHGAAFLIGAGKALDPPKYFIIATDMFASGLSSSPSNT